MSRQKMKKKNSDKDENAGSVMVIGVLALLAVVFVLFAVEPGKQTSDLQENIAMEMNGFRQPTSVFFELASGIEGLR